VGVRPKRFRDRPQHAGTVTQNVVVPKAQDTPPLSDQLCIAPFVMAGQSMLAAIGLDDQPCFDASEVDNVRRDRELPAKAPAELSLAELTPEHTLSIGQVSSKNSCAGSH
jgi:hypothetical protein